MSSTSYENGTKKMIILGRYTLIRNRGTFRLRVTISLQYLSARIRIARCSAHPLAKWKNTSLQWGTQKRTRARGKTGYVKVMTWYILPCRYNTNAITLLWGIILNIIWCNHLYWKELSFQITKFKYRNTCYRMQSKRNLENKKPYLLDEMPPLLLNLTLGTRRLFDTQSWLTHFMYVFSWLTCMDVNRSLTSAADYT